MDYTEQYYSAVSEQAKARVKSLRDSGLGPLPDVEGSEPVLLHLLGRISRIDERARQVCEQLRCHADSMRGGADGLEGDAPRAPERPGAIGQLEDAIDRLNATLSELAAQAERNCGLA